MDAAIGGANHVRVFDSLSSGSVKRIIDNDEARLVRACKQSREYLSTGIIGRCCKIPIELLHVAYEWTAYVLSILGWTVRLVSNLAGGKTASP